MGVETVVIASLVAGTAMGGYSAIESGRAAKADGAAQKKWDDYNAEVSRRNAAATEAAADYETTQQRRQVKQLKGAQRAAFAKSGTTMEGSPLMIAEDTAAQTELDIMMARRNSMIESQQYQSQAVLDNMSGKMAANRGKMAQRGSYWQAGSTILTGVGNAGYAKYSMKKGA